jgi:hypothetical protein
MNFFKQAQDFAASANTNTTDGDNTGAAPGTAPAASGDGGSFGNFLSTASNLVDSQGASPAGDGSAAPPAAQGDLPGGRTAPTNQDLLKSGQLLFDAAQGQQVDQTQLAGAASDILGGLAAHGNLDQGTYGKYIDQAEGYLNNYSAKDQSAAGAGAGAGASPAPAGVDSQVPSDSGDSQDPSDSQSDPQVPAGTTDGSYQ